MKNPPLGENGGVFYIQRFLFRLLLTASQILLSKSCSTKQPAHTHRLNCRTWDEHQRAFLF
jgi:hypothetical protein